MDEWWNETRINELRILFARGVSYESIARAMQITKNMVTSQLGRLDLHRSVDRVKPLFKAEVPARIVGGCLFIKGDPKVILKGGDPFCNAKRRAGSPYCEEHHHRCYQPLPERLKRLERLAG